MLAIFIEFQCSLQQCPAPTLRESLIKLIPILTPFVALYTFYLGSRQKENERNFSFYNDTVVAPAMDELEEFFEKYRDKLSEEARRANDPARKSVPRASTKLITQFSEDLYGLKNALVQRLVVFDETAVQTTEQIVEDLDTAIIQWLASREPKDPDTVGRHLLRAKRALIRTIYKGKFRILH